MKKQLEIAEVARTVSLAAALARREERDSLAAVAVSWITEWTPMQSGAFKPGLVERWVPKVAYGEAELNRLGDWIEHVQGADIGHISIAVDRILRAIFEVEAAESLIDAVIAWENCSALGSKLPTRSPRASRCCARTIPASGSHSVKNWTRSTEMFPTSTW